MLWKVEYMQDLWMIQEWMQQFWFVMYTAVAEAVLDRCMETNARLEEDPTKVFIEFNYEFLDSYHVEPPKEERIHSGSHGVKQEDNKEWRLKFSTKGHPLALMVNCFYWIHHTCNSTQVCSNMGYYGHGHIMEVIMDNYINLQWREKNENSSH